MAALEKAEVMINEIVEKIIAKASFLLSVAQPSSFSEDEGLKSSETDTISKKPSYFKLVSDKENEQ